MKVSAQRVMTDPACVHPAWDDRWVQQEIEACISKVRPLETKPAAKADQISDDGLRSIDEAAPDDVAASDLRAVQRAIASGRWRENSQAKEWAGYAVATVMGLDVANKAHKAKIAGLLKTWIENGMLVVVDGLDDSRRTRSFIEVGTSADA